MTVKELVEVLKGAPQDFSVGVGGIERGSGSVKCIDIDGVGRIVVIWNEDRETIEEEFGGEEE
jgi:hypothetical protein